MWPACGKAKGSEAGDRHQGPERAEGAGQEALLPPRLHFPAAKRPRSPLQAPNGTEITVLRKVRRWLSGKDIYRRIFGEITRWGTEAAPSLFSSLHSDRLWSRDALSQAGPCVVSISHLPPRGEPVIG